ncbi:hypothetical protein ACHWQZ_G018287 [Mnemiopsis leidyi]
MLALLAFTGYRRCRWAEVNSDKFTEVWIQFVESLPKGFTLCGESFSFINIVISSLITLLGESGPSKVVRSPEEVAAYGNWATVLELESVQRRFTRLIDEVGTLPYSRRLEILNLTTLAERQIRGDLIEAFKATSGLTDYGSGGRTEERLNIWYEHFKSLLGSSSCPADLSSPFFNNHVSKSLPINCEPFDLPELEEVLDSLNSSKSPGLDNIPPTVWKLKPFRRDLLGFCNEALVNGRVSDAWTTASIIPIPKKGDLSKPGN